MGRRGFVKTNVKREVKKNGKKSIKEVMVQSAVGTQVYEIQDPSERLIATIGASMFNEPKYYPTDPISQNREYTYDETDIDDHAKMIINTATEIAKSDSPRDLLAIANWARKEMKIRTTPQVLLAVAAHCDETKKHVRVYCKKIIERADELKDVFVASRALFGAEKSLPNSLKRGLADAFQKFGEYDFLKYEGQQRPFFSDVLKMVDRAKDYPLSKPLDHYLKTGEVIDEKATPIVAARKQMAKLKEFGPEAVKLAKESNANWEVMLSQFGNTKEVWEHLINTKALGYMATLRNLRNIIKADVNDKCVDSVCKFISEQAVNSKQLPFRFLAARNAILQGENSSPYGYNSAREYSQLLPKEKAFYNAINNAVNAVVEAMGEIPGRTLVATDESGSMDSPISEKSQMTLKQAGEILAGIFAKKAPGSVVGAFADKWELVKDKELEGSALEIADSIHKMQVGGGTCAENVLRWAIENKEKFDRIIVLSDMQTYNSNGSSYGFGYYSGTGRTATQSSRSLAQKSFKELVDHYRKNINKDCKIHCIDLAGHGQSLTPTSDTNTNLVAGFSEKLLDTVLEFEGLKTEVVDGKKKQVFTLEYIRSNY